ncbi:MAG: sensor histidine kinase [Bacteroidia bacterium]
MKLLNRTSLYYLLFALPVFIVCSLFLYHYVSSEIQDTVDEELWKEKIKVENLIRAGKAVPQDENLVLEPGPPNAAPNETFSDLMLYDSIEGEMIPYRQLSVFLNTNNGSHHLEVRKSTVESDDLIQSIFYPIVVLFVLLLGGFLVINVLISRRLWKPFYATLDKLSNFNISSDAISFDASTTREFAEMNSALNKMTEKIRNDYLNQKKFTENASHEIQTPLAVIKSKIELLIQSPSLSEQDAQIIQSLSNACNKLSLLNKGLLLLSKIENNQFSDVEPISFQQLIEKNLLHLEDLILIKELTIEKNYSADFIYKMNAILADILIQNLIQNAIRHNVKNGSIRILTGERSLRISNSSATTATDTEALFGRFRKSDNSADSIGLGLAIVKEICETYGLQLSYQSRDNIHTITVGF